MNINSRCRYVGIALLLSCYLFTGRALAQPSTATYGVLPEHSTVSFSIVKWMVLRETGRFTQFTGTIRYDPDKPAESTVAFEVRADSIDTGIAMRDSVLRSDDFFAVASFPTLSFRSVMAQVDNPASLRVTGDLTIRGVRQRITIPVTVLGANRVSGVGDLAGFETSFRIDRTAFGVNGTKWSGGRMSLSREVDIELRVAAQAQDPRR